MPNDSAGGRGHEVRVARISARSAITSAAITGLTAVVAVIGIRFAPGEVSSEHFVRVAWAVPAFG